MDPGVEVSSRAAAGASGDPTETGVSFVVDFADKGPHDEAVLLRSLEDFQDVFGKRVGHSFASDAFEAYFAEEGAEVYFAREVGPDPVKAVLDLMDRSAGAGLLTASVDALYVGDYANGANDGLSVEVEDGTDADTWALVVYWDAVEVERFDNLNMNAASENFAPTRVAVSEYVRVRDRGSATNAPNDNPRVIVRTNLAGGTDDHGNAGDDEFQDALDLFTKDLGPGQVWAPGRSSLGVHTMLTQHAMANNRTALLDGPDKASKVTLLGLAAAVQAVGGLDLAFAGMFGSWFDIPGLLTGTTRAVPHSAIEAAFIARADALNGMAAGAAAGEAFRAQYAIGVRTPAGGFTEDDITDLKNAGVNMARQFRNRGSQNYGFRSLSDDSDWVQLSANRERVSLTAELEVDAQEFVFAPVNKKTFSRLNRKLTARCLQHWQAGALHGDAPEEAFFVDTGDTVNTEATMAAKEIKAAVYARFTEFGERVLIGIIKVPTQSRVAA